MRGRGIPGNVLYEYWTPDVHETYDGQDLLYSYWADIPPFPVAEGQRYWMSVQCVMERNIYGQWGWSEAEPIVFSNPLMDFEALGVPRWTIFPDSPINNDTTDLAFELFADETPVERTSWGTIKSMYR